MTTLLLITPTWKIFQYPGDWIFRMGFLVTLGGFSAALGVWWLLRRGRYGSWMGFVSSGLDVSLVSLALGIFLSIGPPLLALNSKVTFEIYFLTLAATALRYDGRICAFAGALAITQYGTLVGITMWQWRSRLHTPEAGELLYGRYSTVDQVTRLILLGSATILAMLLTARAQKLQKQATTDPLTGIGNRAQFDRRVHAELDRAIRYKRSLSVALIDVDHFKKFNDVHGHMVGDTVLVTVAMLLTRSLRRSDIVTRYGGEEFAVVMPEAGSGSAREKLDAVRRGVASAVLDLPTPREPDRLTISAGIASYPEDGATVERLIAIADDRLLQAKRNGRDQVVGSAGVATPG